MAHTWTVGTECIGKYNFPGASPHDLPFKKGDRLVIVAPTKDPSWYKARREDGLEGIIPFNYVQEKTTPSTVKGVVQEIATPSTVKGVVHLQTMPWFHGKISREDAEKLLTPPMNGLFLVRESQNYPGDYTLCVSYDGKVENYRVMRNAKGLVTVDDDEYYDNLIELVEHYQKGADGLPTRLKRPVDVTKPPPSVASRKEFEKQGWAIPRNELIKKSMIGKGEVGDELQKQESYLPFKSQSPSQPQPSPQPQPPSPEPDEVAYDDEHQQMETGSQHVETGSGNNLFCDVMAQIKNRATDICAIVTWKMPKGENGTQSVKVSYSNEKGKKVTVEVDKCECSLENLEPATTYTITVEPTRASQFSHRIKITTKQHFTSKDLLSMSLIGNGHFGCVYKGHLHERKVAFKVSQYFFESELKVLSMVCHENIVKFLGFVEDLGSFVTTYIYVMELADTSLHDYVHDKTKPLNYDTVGKWAQDIAKGLHHLHYEAMKPKCLVHCDLKPKNSNSVCMT